MLQTHRLRIGLALLLGCPPGKKEHRNCTVSLIKIHYMAPEVINKYYNMKCDVWSLGILLYVLLCGNGPFMGETSQEVMQKTLKEAVSFEKQVW